MCKREAKTENLVILWDSQANQFEPKDEVTDVRTAYQCDTDCCWTNPSLRHWNLTSGVVSQTYLCSLWEMFTGRGPGWTAGVPVPGFALSWQKTEGGGGWGWGEHVIPLIWIISHKLSPTAGRTLTFSFLRPFSFKGFFCREEQEKRIVLKSTSSCWTTTKWSSRNVPVCRLPAHRVQSHTSLQDSWTLFPFECRRPQQSLPVEKMRNK